MFSASRKLNSLRCFSSCLIYFVSFFWAHSQNNCDKRLFASPRLSVRPHRTEPTPPDEFLCFRFLRKLAHRFRFYLILVICVFVFTVFCIVCTVFFVLFRLCVFILICFVCTSVRTTATE